MKTIVLTGGGTAGHVTPNIALLPYLRKEGYQINYIGSHNGIEKELISSLGINYYGISSGKLRRYLDFKNLTDMFKVVKGLSDAFILLKKLKPSIVFSKGGFVSVPVVMAAALLKIPVVVHESDITPGLANKLSVPFASAVCTAFPEACDSVKGEKGVLTGTPIRQALFKGKKEIGLELCGFDKEKPILLAMGGSLGSVKVNESLRKALSTLLTKYQIIHLCGKGNLDENLSNVKGYKQFEYISKELADIFACCDLVVSRAGANSIYEFLALKKPMLLIPLSRSASRGDQILNAESFQKQGFSAVLEEEDLTTNSLIDSINQLYDGREDYISAMNKTKLANGCDEVMKQILKYTKLENKKKK